MRFQLHEMNKAGEIWHSEILDADQGEREIARRVVAGYTGTPRWATAIDVPGFFVGINAKGQRVSTPFPESHQ